MVDFVGQLTASARTTARLEIDLGAGLRRLDWVLMLAVAALVGYGLWAIAGITRFDVPGDPRHDVIRQAIAAGLGAVAFVVAAAVPPSFVRSYWRAIYAGTIGMMLFVFLAGPAIRGSKRWLVIGPFQLQPSEFGKVLFVVALAGFLADRSWRIGSARTVLTAVGLGAIPMGLVFMQPDFGTAMVYAAALVAVLFVAGTRWLHIAALGVLAAFLVVSVLWLLPAAGLQVLKPYQTQRITGFTHPSSDPSGATYNITQSLTAVGAGGPTGRGVSGASQTRLDYLP
jgi:rod shape determining protein RodA